MGTITLDDFIAVHRDELITRCRKKVAQRSPPAASRSDDDHGVPRLLDQIVAELRNGRSPTDEIITSATKNGTALLREGFSVGQVVHGYGDVCQAVTQLAVQLDAPISADDFGTLNRCLDDAIAGAVTAHARAHRATAATSEVSAEDLRNLADTALIALGALQSGHVGVGGSTGGVLMASLKAIRALAERPSMKDAPLSPR